MSLEGGPEFQALCVTRLGEVLAANGFGKVPFEYVEGDLGCYAAQFVLLGKRYEIEVYETGPVMLCGEQLFESFMPEEFESDEAHREGFVTRLERYLGGGPWDDYERIGLWRRFKRLFEK